MVEATPDEIMREARDIAFDFDCDWTADGRRRGDREYQAAIDAIGRALMARDTAAEAKVAQLMEALSLCLAALETASPWIIEQIGSIPNKYKDAMDRSRVALQQEPLP